MIQKFNKVQLNSKENLIRIYSFNFNMYLIKIPLEKTCLKLLLNQI